MSVTKESNSKKHDYNIKYFTEKERICTKMEKKDYNLHLSVVMLLHMSIPCPQKHQLAPSMLT